MGRRGFPCPRWSAGQRRALERSHMAGKVEAVSAQKVRRTTGAVKAKLARIGMPKVAVDARQGELSLDGCCPAGTVGESQPREDDHAATRHRHRHRQRSARRASGPPSRSADGLRRGAAHYPGAGLLLHGAVVSFPCHGRVVAVRRSVLGKPATAEALKASLIPTRLGLWSQPKQR